MTHGLVARVRLTGVRCAHNVDVPHAGIVRLDVALQFVQKRVMRLSGVFLPREELCGGAGGFASGVNRLQKDPRRPSRDSRGLKDANSGGGIGARVQLEVAGDLVARRGGVPTGQIRGMAAHRRPALAFKAASSNPRRMGLKENDRRPRCIRHDSNSSRATRKNYQQWLSVRDSRMPG